MSQCDVCHVMYYFVNCLVCRVRAYCLINLELSINATLCMYVFRFCIHVCLPDPHAAKRAGDSKETTAAPGTVFSMPLLPQSTADNSCNIHADTDTDTADKDNTTEDAAGKDLDLGYKGLLEDVDDDDKVWDNFTTTIEAVSYYARHCMVSRFHAMFACCKKSGLVCSSTCILCFAMLLLFTKEIILITTPFTRDATYTHYNTPSLHERRPSS
jgi:hypothetical protein